MFLIETIYSKESYKSLAYIIGMNYTTGISLQEIQDWDKKISKITAKEIKFAVQEIFAKQKRVKGYLLPK